VSVGAGVTAATLPARARRGSPYTRRVAWKKTLNEALARRTGYRLEKARGTQLPGAKRRRRLREGDRLLERPTFILCSVRSGSTLLRVLLGSHSQIHCPHELHLRDIGVTVPVGPSQKALSEVGLDDRRLEYLLWDRVLHRELDESGKRLLVNKTPNDVFIVDRILECWPDARFIFLLRHPGAIAQSRQAARPQDSAEKNAKVVARYCNAVEEARRAHDGITVRYEELATDPVATTRRLCEFLGVPWEQPMLEYGEFSHGRFKVGLGDWSENIKSGRVQPPAPPPSPEEVPPQLHDVSRAWGYLDSGAASGAPGVAVEHDVVEG
jgi:Sulfotransferase family